MKLFLMLLLGTLHLSCFAEKNSVNVYLGVLEYDKEVGARVAFLKNKGRWQSIKITNDKLENSIKVLPKELHWLIYFDGKILGKVTSKYEKQSLNSKTGLMTIVKSLDQLPKIKDKLNLFSNWEGEKKFRPLILTTNKTIDPDRWKPYNIKGNALNSFKSIFIKKLGGNVDNCTKYIEGKEQEFLNTKLNNQNVSLLKAYKSSKDEVLFGISTIAKYECDGPSSEEYSIHWFYKTKNSVKFVGNQIMPIDAGDFDNDGKSEWMFSKSGYNLGGYKLFYDNFKNSVKFEWVYH